MRRRRAVTRPRAKHLPPSAPSQSSGDFVAQPVRCVAQPIIAHAPSQSNECVVAIEKEVTMDISLESLCSRPLDATNVGNCSVETTLPPLGSRECVAGGGNDDNIDRPLLCLGSAQLDAMKVGHYSGEASLPSLGGSGQEDTSQDSSVRRGLPAKARKMRTWERWCLALVLLCATLMDRSYENFAQSARACSELQCVGARLEFQGASGHLNLIMRHHQLEVFREAVLANPFFCEEVFREAVRHHPLEVFALHGSIQFCFSRVVAGVSVLTGRHPLVASFVKDNR